MSNEHRAAGAFEVIWAAEHKDVPPSTNLTVSPAFSTIVPQDQLQLADAVMRMERDLAVIFEEYPSAHLKYLLELDSIARQGLEGENVQVPFASMALGNLRSEVALRLGSIYKNWYTTGLLRWASVLVLPAFVIAMAAFAVDTSAPTPTLQFVVLAAELLTWLGLLTVLATVMTVAISVYYCRKLKWDSSVEGGAARGLRTLNEYASTFRWLAVIATLFAVVLTGASQVIDSSEIRAVLATVKPPLFSTIGCLALIVAGSAVGTTLSYVVRHRKLGFDDLVVIESDQLDTAPRLVVVALFSVVLALLFHAKVIEVAIAGLATADVLSSPLVAFVLGVLAGVSEQALPSKLAEQAGKLFEVGTTTAKKGAGN